MMERTAASGTALMEQLRALLQQTGNLLHAVGDDWDETYAVLHDRVQEAAETARLQLADVQRKAGETTQRLRVAAEAYAHEHPWTTVSIGAAVGLVLGSLVAQRRD
jgi:ElaB/YqjD/DUF883 family membrane-anchored ribosome-binding protein